MTIAEYFESVKDRLLADSFIFDFKVVKYVDRSKNGHLRVRVVFSDESRLDFSEFVEQVGDDEIRLTTYSYHWSDKNDNLIRRWDNSPHFRKPRESRHHIHIRTGEAEEKVAPGASTDIFAVLDEIARIISHG